MDRERDSSETNLPDAIRIDEICDEFEAARKAGKSVAIEDFLTRVPEALVPMLIEELIGLEIDYRQSDGLPVDVEAIQKRFPQLRDKIAERTLQWRGTNKAKKDKRNGHERDRSSTTLRYVGDYELLSIVARGGMGIVYRARQISLGRIVAVKTILDEQLATPEQVARFKSEACAAANLDHPDIVPIYEVGEHEDCHFYSMAFVDGTNLADRLKGGPVEPHDAVALMTRVCRAVHYAHENGVVHRDLKPQNILIDRLGRPRITDFGLAKRIAEDSAATRYGDVMGTPSYMPPEQASGKLELIGPLSDVYSLGALLFALLSGRPPFQAPSAIETLRQVIEQEPLLLRQLSPSVPRDVETIVAKCLEKAPPRRYGSAAALADDLERWSRGEPIHARPVSFVERGWRWCTRNPYTAVPLAAVATLLVAITIGSWIAANSFKRISIRAEASSKLADKRAIDTRLELARSQVNGARARRMTGWTGRFTEAMTSVRAARDIMVELEKHGYPVPETDWANLRNEAASAQLVPDLLIANRWPREADEIRQASADLVHQRYVVLRNDQSIAELRRIGTGELLEIIPGAPNTQYRHGIFSRQGDRLALYSVPDGKTHFFDVSGIPRFLSTDDSSDQFVMISDDGNVHVRSGGNSTRVVRVADGLQLDQTNVGPPIAGYPIHPHAPRVAVHADGVGVYDYEQKRMVWSQPASSGTQNVVWSPDGRFLLTNTTGTLRTLDGETGETLQTIDHSDQPDGIFPVFFPKAGLTGSFDWSGSFRWHDSHTGRLRLQDSFGFFELARAMGERGHIAIAYSGKEYLVLEPRQSRLTEFAPQSYFRVALSSSGSLLVVTRKAGHATLYHLPSCLKLADLPSSWGDLPFGFEPDESALYLYGGGEAKRVPLVWRDGEHTELVVKEAERFFAEGTREHWGADRALKTIGVPGVQSLIYKSTGDDAHRTMERTITQHQFDVRSVSISPNGKWMVQGSHVNGKVAVYSTDTTKWVADLYQSGGWGVFSPNDQWLAVGKFAGGGELFTTDSWKAVGKLPGSSFAFSEDGRLLAVDDGPGTISFIDTSDLHEVGRLMLQDNVRVHPKAFTPNGTGLVAVTLEEGRCLYFDLAGLRSDLKELGLDWKWPRNFAEATEETPIPRARIETTKE